MPTEPALGCTHDAQRVFRAQSDEAGAERDDQIPAERSLAIRDRLIDHQAHSQIALHASRQRAVRGIDAVARPLHVGHEIGEHHLLDTGLAQRGQHTVDVAQEHPVRPDDEHALVLEREPVRVQQIRGSVERDDGLARTRPSLHHQHARLGRADDLVLLALDGGHDVAELTGTTALQHREQRAVTANAFRPAGRRDTVLRADAEVTLAEQLVLDAEKIPAVHVEVATAHQTERLATGRAVERLGDRRPPVHHHGVGELVGHRETADVEALRRLGRRLAAVDAAEHEGGIAEIELGETVEDRLVEHVALVAGLERATERAFVKTAHLPRVGLALLEAAIGEVDELLLSGEIRVVLCHVETGHVPGRGPKTWSENSIGASRTHHNLGVNPTKPLVSSVVAMPPAGGMTAPVTQDPAR